MKLLCLPRSSTISALRNEFHSGQFPNSHKFQVASKLNPCREEFVSKLLNRRWALISPDTKIHQIMVSESDEQIQQRVGAFGSISFLNNPQPYLGNSMKKNKHQSSFYVVRDDLLHPLVNDRGLKSHLLLRGEQPETLTGYNLISMLYGNVTYIPRSLYAKREEMLARHADLIAGSCGSVVCLSDLFEASFRNHTSGKPNFVQMDAHRGSENIKKVVIVNEGAGDAVGLLGVIRLVQYLAQNHLLGKEKAFKIVVDAGTGTTAVGLGLGAICLGLPWEVTSVTLADTIDGYRKLEERLISEFRRCCAFPPSDQVLNRVNGGIVRWVERIDPRKFGNVLKGEVEACQRIAQQTGVLVDPVYTLAAWELATQLSQEEAGGGPKVVMLHTGGTLGMFGLAQRYKSYFQMLKDGLSS